MSDEALVVHIRDSHPEDFEQIISRYQTRLFCYVCRYIKESAKAEDVLQDAFIKMYVNLQSFDADRSFSAWAYRIAHNEAMNFIKKHRREVVIDDEGWFERIADDKVDFAADYDKKLTRQQIQSALNSLALKYKEVVVLYYFEEQDYNAIAKILQIPRSTVGVRIRRAKSKLKQVLDKEAVS